MSSLIETTVGVVRAACVRMYQKYNESVTEALQAHNSKIAEFNSLSWWKKVFRAQPEWSIITPEWWDWSITMDKRDAVWRLEQSIKDLPNHTVMHITTEDARLIQLGTLE